MKNNKGFSLVELLAVIAILGILFGLGLQAYSVYQEKAKKDGYDTMAKSASQAAEEYIMEHPAVTEIDFETLFSSGFLSSLQDPGSRGEECTGKVNVTTTKGSNDVELDENNYTVAVCCTNYNYTYEFPSKEKHIDKYCKAQPYDIEEIKDKLKEIKVLNVYPKEAGNNLKTWMDTYGKGIIKVTPVALSDFNANPESYIGTSGNWNYDEIVFGFWDCYASKDLSAKAAEEMSKYLMNGGAAIFGHDTITANGCGSHVNFNTLAGFVNLTLNSGVRNYKSSDKVKIQKSGVFTKYPYDIEKEGEELRIPTSHVYGQVANGDVWITFSGPNMESDIPANKIYLSTYGNNAFIQTGHSNGKATEQEQQIIANIIFYMVAKQYVEE